MAYGTLSKFYRTFRLSKVCNKLAIVSYISTLSSKNLKSGRRKLLIGLGLLAGGAGTLLFALNQSVEATTLAVHPSKQPWSHDGLFSSLDHGSIRRGYEVYKLVCSACHSLKYIAYRELIGVSHTEAEARAEAAEATVTDGPDSEGNMFQRPGKLSDRIPPPYTNEEAARFANNGAYPPDLTYILSARHGGEDYVFALLTGYCDPPAGVTLRDGQYYNPYFPGGATGMAQMIFNESIQYADGTPATASQLAKDVCTFLKWTAEPEHDQRKRLLVKAVAMFTLLTFICYYYKRHKWITMKTRKIMMMPKRRRR